MSQEQFAYLVDWDAMLELWQQVRARRFWREFYRLREFAPELAQQLDFEEFDGNGWFDRRAGWESHDLVLDALVPRISPEQHERLAALIGGVFGLGRDGPPLNQDLPLRPFERWWRHVFAISLAPHSVRERLEVAHSLDLEAVCGAVDAANKESRLEKNRTDYEAVLREYLRLLEWAGQSFRGVLIDIG